MRAMPIGSSWSWMEVRLVCVFSSHIKLQGSVRPGIGRKLDWIIAVYVRQAQERGRGCSKYVRGCKGATSMEFYFLFIVKLLGGSVIGITL